MKVIAMYLPQFHKVKENDEWWGEDFTDWVSAKNANPLFEGHYQPHIPMNDNYYDLMDKNTMHWQAELMHKYGIDGMCMYHYWFKDGRQILEKPAENLLKWKDIDMPFCFCWANESWARSWSGIKGTNTWSNINEPAKKEGEKAVLLEQSYGNKTQWERHFEYFLPFFKDERYIMQDGKPLLLIYKSGNIPCLDEMILCWQKLAVENGLQGIYVIGANYGNDKLGVLDAELIHEPSNSIAQIRAISKKTQEADTCDYEMLWRRILQTVPRKHKTYYGGFVGYDDTPRHGNKGMVVRNQEPQIFRKYITQLIAKNAKLENELVFINAWNEWGEGMHLEPDEKYGEAYLEAIKAAKSDYLNVKFQNAYIEENLELNSLRVSYKKIERNMMALDSWMWLKEHGKSLVSYFDNLGYHKIALYGYGILGKHFVKEFENQGVSIEYIIDQQGDKIKSDIPIYTFGKELNNMVDVIVISVTFDIEEIKGELNNQGFINIVTIEEIINKMVNREVAGNA